MFFKILNSISNYFYLNTCNKLFNTNDQFFNYSNILEVNKLCTLEQLKKAYFNKRREKTYKKIQNNNFEFYEVIFDVILENFLNLRLFTFSIIFYILFFKIHSEIILKKYDFFDSTMKRKIFDSNSSLKINLAYNFLSNHINIKLYNNSNISEFKEDFFKRMALSNELFLAPNYSDVDFKHFYNFWKLAKVDEREYFLSLLRYLKSVDPRINMMNKSNISNKNTCNKNKCNKNNTSKKIKPYFCNYCKKGFNSIQTLENHCKSKSHIRNLKNFDQKNDIQKNFDQKNDSEKRNLNVKIDSEKSNSNVQIESEKRNSFGENNKEIQSKDECVLSSQINHNIYHNIHHNPSEHHIFRTCDSCRKVFSTRGDLILHRKQGCNI